MLTRTDKRAPALSSLLSSVPMRRGHRCCLYYVVSCPPTLHEEVGAILRSARCVRLFGTSGDSGEGARAGDEAWKGWRGHIVSTVVGALKLHTRTHQARLLFLEDSGSKLCRDEWSEWPNLRKAFDVRASVPRRTTLN
jgi:hypothetical protein